MDQSPKGLVNGTQLAHMAIIAVGVAILGQEQVSTILANILHINGSTIAGIYAGLHLLYVFYGTGTEAEVKQVADKIRQDIADIKQTSEVIKPIIEQEKPALPPTN